MSCGVSEARCVLEISSKCDLWRRCGSQLLFLSQLCLCEIEVLRVWQAVLRQVVLSFRLGRTVRHLAVFGQHPAALSQVDTPLHMLSPEFRCRKPLCRPAVNSAWRCVSAQPGIASLDCACFAASNASVGSVIDAASPEVEVAH